MKLDHLIATAAALPHPPPEAVSAYQAQSESLVAAVNATMLARPDVHELVGKQNLGMMQDNHANHARFVASILLAPDPTVLVETVLWVFRAYRHHGFALTYWPAQLNAWIHAIQQQLAPEHAAAVLPLYDWFIVRQPAFADLSNTMELPGGPTPSHG
jgi:hypothetical protein